ncbi:hypothetical protein MBEHAL_1936 [Halarchaeum acidiphilum MH1-52-1]|uniref:DUF2150 domain-containing protein n=1 Tax=Halarchaeum acidiphilum MH1-52-1 TaxID=1261545 RepID=U2YG42_9EURY|nr:DUF2150 family protein [Halarchaeum acidiphilum]GAD53176.1 hypothetical protein MBEHAL_1936 [Halarchaeum acidiphilum MH1-52-1]
MSDTEEEFYSAERWQNWLDRLRDEELDPEDEDSARLLYNLQDDVAIAVAKIVSAHQDDELTQDEAMDELESIREVVLAEPDFDDEDKRMLVEGVQTSLVAVFYSADVYVSNGPAEDASVQEYVEAAAAAEQDEEFDRALDLTAGAGSRLFEGEEVDLSITEELEYGPLTDWLSGLDSLQSALADPEVIEDEESA